MLKIFKFSLSRELQKHKVFMDCNASTSICLSKPTCSLQDLILTLALTCRKRSFVNHYVANSYFFIHAPQKKIDTIFYIFVILFFN